MILRRLPAVVLIAVSGAAWAQSGQPLQLPPAALPGLPEVPQAAPPSGTPAPKAQATRPVPLPPRRPAGLEAAATGAVPRPAAPQPAVAPEAEDATIQPAAVDNSPKAILDRVNASLNTMTQVTADFVQVGGNGRRAEGRLYVQKPGRLRFEYKPPSPVEIVADGSSVVIRDRKLGTQDMYPLGQTPLKFLLKEQIDLARDTRVVDVQGGPDVVSATVEDRTTFGGTSRVQMLFDPRTYRLKQWTVVDPQGYQTTVNLQNVDLRTRPDPAIFSIDYQRVLGEDRSNNR